MCDSDMYLHIFVLPEPPDGTNVNSERPATLEAIKHRDGEPLMNSQIVEAAGSR
jgi:hypothetical protein